LSAPTSGGAVRRAGSVSDAARGGVTGACAGGAAVFQPDVDPFLLLGGEEPVVLEFALKDVGERRDDVGRRSEGALIDKVVAEAKDRDRERSERSDLQVRTL
jgi:hypothetical protein